MKNQIAFAKGRGGWKHIEGPYWSAQLCLFPNSLRVIEKRRRKNAEKDTSDQTIPRPVEAPISVPSFAAPTTLTNSPSSCAQCTRAPFPFIVPFKYPFSLSDSFPLGIYALPF